MHNYNNKKFRLLAGSATGEVSSETTFLYRQEGEVIWGTYQGGAIKFGTLTGIVDPTGTLHFSYQHVNAENEIMTGRCVSKASTSDTGKLQLHEKWQWTCNDRSAGHSIIEEIEVN